MTTQVVDHAATPPSWISDERYAYVGRWDIARSYEEAQRGLDGRFGNIWVLRSERHRDQILAAYRRWFLRRLADDPSFAPKLELLRGKILVCHCAPRACHGDVIAAWLDGTL